ncbi:hypothetical protein [Rhodosalinus sediminis]|uniref:hypothetical protein n=1 Tax=Rhodosalinus sediminis TaxID=1940533 RepID=UPI002352F001|nr:hypothetical protein [Rhodosalinus sediminis]
MSDRDKYVEEAKAQLDRWNAQIEELQQKMQSAEAQARKDYENQLEELRAQRDAAQKQLDKMREASDAAWDDMKAGFDRAWDQIASAFDTARARFK